MIRLLTALALVASGLALTITSVATNSTPALAATTCPPSPSQLDNGGFEAPVIPNNSYRLVNENAVPGWSTTATDKQIELWSTPFNGVTAFEGRQFAELNATQASALYQDLPTTPGQTLTWSLAHRARQGTDTMRVVIGSPGASGVENSRFSDTTAGWGRHTGTYVVPANQTITRFAFEAVSSGSGNPTIGNFLDDISFGTPACVLATKSVTPEGPRNVGDTVMYTIGVENEGGSATSDVVITDVLPAGVEYVAGSLMAPGTYNAQTRTLTFRPSTSPNPPVIIGPGELVEVTFQAKILPSASGTTITNFATVAATDGLGITDTFNTNSVSTPVPVAADVAISKNFDPSEIASAGTSTMSLLVTNNGPGIAASVTATDALPTGLTVTGQLPSGCSITSGTITCAFGDLGPGSTVLRQITIAAPSVVTATSYMNTARVTTTTNDYNLSNNASIAGLAVAALSPAHLDIAKIVTRPNVLAGDSDSVLIGVLNSGQTSTASDLVVTDTIPTGFAVITANWHSDANSGVCSITTLISCPIGILGPGSTAVVTVSGQTSPDLAPGSTLTDTATATSTGTNSPTAQATITVGANADLYLRKQSVSNALAGQPLDYTVVVENIGPSTAHSASVSDALPAGITVTALPQNCTVTNQTMTCALGDLEPGDIATLPYTVELPLAGGTFTNTATATSTTPSTDPSHASDSTTTAVVPVADLEATKTASKDSAKIGDTITYTVTVTNLGPGAATSVQVIDDNAVGGLRRVSTSPSIGSIDPTTGNWLIGSLAVGESVTNTITAVAIEVGTVANSVFVESANPDNDGDNNTASATVVVAGSGLPATGTNSARLLGLGGLTLLLGGILVLVSRRRTTA